MTPKQVIRAVTSESEWSDAFAAQCTASLHAEVRRYAITDLRMTSDDAQDIVQRALVDTLSGARRWNPAERSLLDHVRATVWSRFRCDQATATRWHQVAFDPGAAESSAHAVHAEVEAALATRANEAAAEEEMDEYLDQLRDIAADDREVLAILDAVDAGARNRAEVLTHAGLSLATYRNASLRLSRFRKRLPNLSQALCA